MIGRVVTATALLGAAAASIAVPDDDRRTTQPVVTSATAPLAHSNSRDGRAILTAANLRPGEHRTGEVTIANRGHEGALYLVAGPPRGRLSERLQVAITDVTRGSARSLGSAPMATMARCRPLGRFGEREARTYRFAVRLPGDAGNAYAGTSASVGFEWLQTATARSVCPSRSEDVVRVPQAEPQSGAVASGGRVAVTLGDMRLAIVPGPYRFSGRRGTAKVGIRCVESATGTCRGRLALERWKGGQGKGIAMAVGRFAIKEGSRRKVTIKLNPRARRRIKSKRAVAVRAFVTATDASGRRHRVAYKDRLVYRR